jgi:hypothetical protein
MVCSTNRKNRVLRARATETAHPVATACAQGADLLSGQDLNLLGELRALDCKRRPHDQGGRPHRPTFVQVHGFCHENSMPDWDGYAQAACLRVGALTIFIHNGAPPPALIGCLEQHGNIAL